MLRPCLDEPLCTERRALVRKKGPEDKKKWLLET